MLQVKQELGRRERAARKNEGVERDRQRQGRSRECLQFTKGVVIGGAS